MRGPNGYFQRSADSKNATLACACFRIYPSSACSRHVPRLSFAQQALRTPSLGQAVIAGPWWLLLFDKVRAFTHLGYADRERSAIWSLDSEKPRLCVLCAPIIPHGSYGEETTRALSSAIRRTNSAGRSSRCRCSGTELGRTTLIDAGSQKQFMTAGRG
jgi:hypothetical protein